MEKKFFSFVHVSDFLLHLNFPWCDKKIRLERSSSQIRHLIGFLSLKNSLHFHVKWNRSMKENSLMYFLWIEKKVLIDLSAEQQVPSVLF